MLQKLVHTLLLLLLLSPLYGQQQWQLFNDGWRYLQGGSLQPGELPGEGWAAIQLPHSWNQWDATDNLPGYRRSHSWYRKTWTAKPEPGRRYWLYLEGANTKAEIYLNGQQAGDHTGGYLGFSTELTPYLQDGENSLLIRVDNAYDPNLIPSQKSDFFIFGGLTRDAWLVETPQRFIHQLQVRTPEVSADRASTQLQVQLRRKGQPAGKAELKSEIRRAGEVVASAVLPVADGSGDLRLDMELPDIQNPELWSPATPQLYELEVSYYEDGQLVDRKSERIGYRWYEFGAEGAFYLNGERLLLRGTHRHEEHAGYGAAMPDSLHRRDMEAIREVGANFIRLGHYPQDPEVYRACDELGLIVWDELPWCRGGMGGEEWQQNTRRLLREQIEQNYNHPSIFFWSLGNEIYWLPDFPGGGDTARLNHFLTGLDSLAHELDPGRMTAIRKYYAGAHLVDVFSPSIWSGWYAGVYTNYESTLEKQRERYPRFLHMEYGGSSHVGRHTETPITGDGMLDADDWEEVVNQVGIKNIAKDGDWTESYIVDLFDWHLSVSEATPWLAGNAQWAFKDFGTPLRPENAIPYLNQKGLVDRAGKPKDAYYVFKSYWAEAPFTYIESHSWTERSGPEGKARQVCVFSNCEEVSLLLNGQPLGERARELGNFPANNLRWNVPFAAGKNQLIAIGYRNGQEVARDSLAIHYRYERHGKPDHIELQASALPNGKLLLEAFMMDAEGRRVLDYEKRLYFSADGPGELLVNYGTPTRSQVIEMANGRAAIELQPAAGRTVVEARNQDFKGSYLTLDLEENDLNIIRQGLPWATHQQILPYDK